MPFEKTEQPSTPSPEKEKTEAKESKIKTPEKLGIDIRYAAPEYFEKGGPLYEWAKNEARENYKEEMRQFIKEEILKGRSVEEIYEKPKFPREKDKEKRSFLAAETMFYRYWEGGQPVDELFEEVIQEFKIEKPKEKVEGKIEEEKINKEIEEEKIEKEGTKEKELSPEEMEGAEKFDRELSEIIGSLIKTGELSPEKANEIFEVVKELKPKDKADLMKDLEKEKFLPEEDLKEKEKAKNELEESVSKYEEAIDNLVERAKNLGIEISREELMSYLEKFRNIEPEPGEKMEWLEDFKTQIEKLEQTISNLEKSKEGRKLTPEEEKKAKEGITKAFEELTTKIIEYTVKLIVKISKGITKGVIKAFRKE